MNLRLEEMHESSHSGQHDYSLYALYTEGEEEMVVGRIMYTLYENAIHVGMVEVLPEYKRKGIGKALYRKMHGLHHTCTFPRSGWYTDEGKLIRLWFEREVLRTCDLKRDGRVLFTGHENDCFRKLHRVQSQSAHWAIKYEGYSIEPIQVIG